MVYKIVELTENAKLYVYVSDIRMNPKPRDGVLVIPGGGYDFVSLDREGEPVALTFCGKGMSCFVLEYSVKEKATFPTPLREAARAMAHIKAHAQEYDVDPDRIFIMGFSAGGHLTASLGTYWHREDVTGVPAQMAKPKGMVLVYPVIIFGEFAHEGSFRHLCGTEHPSQEQIEAWSLEKQVSENTVPTFLLHTATDQVVPVENTLVFAMALSAKKIPMEIHVFPQGHHGLALASFITGRSENDMPPEFAQWPDLARDWMNRTK